MTNYLLHLLTRWPWGWRIQAWAGDRWLARHYRQPTDD